MNNNTKLFSFLFAFIFIVISAILYIDWQRTLDKTDVNRDSIFSSSKLDFIWNISFLQDVYPVEKIDVNKNKLDINIDKYKQFVSMYKQLQTIQNKDVWIWSYNADKNMKQNIIIKPTIYDYIQGINKKSNK